MFNITQLENFYKTLFGEKFLLYWNHTQKLINAIETNNLNIISSHILNESVYEENATMLAYLANLFDFSFIKKDKNKIGSSNISIWKFKENKNWSLDISYFTNNRKSEEFYKSILLALYEVRRSLEVVYYHKESRHLPLNSITAYNIGLSVSKYMKWEIPVNNVERLSKIGYFYLSNFQDIKIIKYNAINIGTNSPKKVKILEPDLEYLKYCSNISNVSSYEWPLFQPDIPDSLHTAIASKPNLMDSKDFYYSKESINARNSNVLRALIKLNSIPWSINKDMVEYFRGYFYNKFLDLDMEKNLIKPTNPLVERKKVLTQEDKELYKQYIHNLNIYNEECKKRIDSLNQFIKWLMADVLLKLKKPFYFSHYIDFRGRIYKHSDLNFDQDDFTRSLLIFNKPAKLTEDNIKYLIYHIAGLLNIKGNSEYKFNLVINRKEEILLWGKDPHSYLGWKEYDDKYQLLAAAIAWYRYDIGKTTRCYLPISLDATNSAYQIIALLLSNEQLAFHTNLTNSDEPQDLYQYILDKVKKKMCEENDEALLSLSKKLIRKHVKHIIMTTPYGLTKYGAMEKLMKHEFNNLESRAIEKFIKMVLDSDFRLIVELQKFFIEIATIVSQLKIPILWKSPTNLFICLSYRKKNLKGESFIINNTKYSISTYSDEIDINKTRSAIIANFIHSLDASIATKFLVNTQLGSINTVHDCFYTSVDDFDKLDIEIKNAYQNVFYDQNLLKEFRDLIIDSVKSAGYDPDNLKIKINKKEIEVKFPEVPSLGSFDILQIRDSKYIVG